MPAVAAIEEYRRSKTALFLIACGWAGAAPHWIDPARSLLPAITLAFLLGGYALRTVFLRDRQKALLDHKGEKTIEKISFPNVDILVAARDEENVLRGLVEGIGKLRYPKEKLSLWIVDDGSKDTTPILLDELSKDFKYLKMIRRSSSEGGGKSGALNKALASLQGEWLLVLDADAQLQDDSLRRLITYAVQGDWSAVQLRKAVVNSQKNLLTGFQAMEMAMDAAIQQGRLLGGGVVELRGNGQLIRRSVLDSVGGFNEETVTDDLDLSFRLLMDGALVGILWDPPVQEEAVETVSALWRQRQRWAEGGLQRFFDYWPTLISHSLTIAQRRDLTCFFLLQYVLPIVSIFDLLTAFLTRTLPLYWPLSVVALSVSGLAYWSGCKTESEGPLLPKPNLWKIFMAIIYLSHWFIVIPWVTLKMAILPKKLVWAKTTHRGQ